MHRTQIAVVGPLCRRAPEDRGRQAVLCRDASPDAQLSASARRIFFGR